jgi:hypothetical protein
MSYDDLDQEIRILKRQLAEAQREAEGWRHAFERLLDRGEAKSGEPKPTAGSHSISDKERTRLAAANPFSKTAFNLTEQMKVVRSDPAFARTLARAAGVELRDVQ